MCLGLRCWLSCLVVVCVDAWLGSQCSSLKTASSWGVWLKARGRHCNPEGRRRRLLHVCPHEALLRRALVLVALSERWLSGLVMRIAPLI